MARLQVGDRIPPWEGITIDAQRISSETLLGRPLVLILLRGLR